MPKSMQTLRRGVSGETGGRRVKLQREFEDHVELPAVGADGTEDFVAVVAPRHLADCHDVVGREGFGAELAQELVQTRAVGEELVGGLPLFGREGDGCIGEIGGLWGVKRVRQWVGWGKLPC